jgi:multidrug efflux pump subunit AcrB
MPTFDRVRAEMLGVSIDRVFETLEVYLGSVFVNEFNFLGRTFRVTAQADGGFRQEVTDIARLKTRNDAGEMVPIGSVAEFVDRTGPYRVTRYNLSAGGRGAGKRRAGRFHRNRTRRHGTVSCGNAAGWVQL